MIKYGLQEYRARWITSAAAVSVGIVLMVCLANVLGAVHLQATKHLRRYKGNVVVVSPLAGHSLSNADADLLRRLPGVRSVVPQFTLVRQAEACGKLFNVALEVVGPNHDFINDLSLQAGRFIGPADAEFSRNVAVIDADMIQDRPCLAKDGRMLIDGVFFRVIGAIRGGTASLKAPAAAWPVRVPEQAVLRRYGSSIRGGVTLIVYMADDMDMAPAIAHIRRALRGRYDLASTDQEQFAVRTPRQIEEDWEALTASLTQGLFGLLLAAQFTAALGLFNTIFMGVAQRTSELGLRRSLGATRSHLATGILGEALGVAIVGIALGIALGVAASAVISSLVSLPFYMNWRVAAASATAALLFSTAAGIVPAVRAANLPPVEALRYES
jgi:putative ABC transport system permease protein